MSLVLPEKRQNYQFENWGYRHNGIFQFSGGRIANARYRIRRGLGNLGRNQSTGGLRSGQPGFKIAGHEATHGGRRRRAYRNDSRAVTGRAFLIKAGKGRINVRHT